MDEFLFFVFKHILKNFENLLKKIEKKNCPVATPPKSIPAEALTNNIVTLIFVHRLILYAHWIVDRYRLNNSFSTKPPAV